MQEHMMSALTRLYYFGQPQHKQWVELGMIEGGSYLVHVFYKWLQNVLSCKIPLPMEKEEVVDTSSNTPTSITPTTSSPVSATAQPIEDKGSSFEH